MNNLIARVDFLQDGNVKNKINESVAYERPKNILSRNTFLTDDTLVEKYAVRTSNIASLERNPCLKLLDASEKCLKFEEYVKKYKG